MIDLFRGSLEFLKEAYPSKPTFSPADLPDLSGKIAIVTGANSGVGKEVTKVLLGKNAKVYMACRNKASAEVAIAELKEETGKEAYFLELDLANLRQIRLAAETFTGMENELHMLINNAGVMWTPVDMLTAENYDLQFGTNVLGHFYFTKLLLPILTETAKSSPERQVRVVTESSIMRHLVHKIDLDTLKAGERRDKCTSNELYCQSKFGAAVFAKELARRYADQGIVSIGCAPGIIKTNLLRHTNSVLSFLIDTLYMYAPPFGALTPTFAAASPEAKDLNGKFLIPWAKVASPGKGVDDSQIGEELWAWMEEQAKDIA